MMTPISLIQSAPLLALDPGLLEVLGVLFAFIIWILGQISAVVRKAQQNAQRPPVMAEEQQPAGEQPVIMAEAANPREAKLADEIEQFLREAAERRGNRPMAPGEMDTPRKPATGRVNRGRRTREPLTTNPLDSNPPRPLAPPAAPESVAAHVKSHLDTHQFEDRAAHLASVDSEKKIDQHLHQAFDHKLGKLADSTMESRGYTVPADRPAATVSATAPTTEAAGPATPGSSLASLLLDPSNLKNAVILNEILRRPEDRWVD